MCGGIYFMFYYKNKKCVRACVCLCSLFSFLLPGAFSAQNLQRCLKPSFAVVPARNNAASGASTHHVVLAANALHMRQDKRVRGTHKSVCVAPGTKSQNNRQTGKFRESRQRNNRDAEFRPSPERGGGSPPISNREAQGGFTEQVSGVRLQGLSNGAQTNQQG